MLATGLKPFALLPRDQSALTASPDSERVSFRGGKRELRSSFAESATEKTFCASLSGRALKE
jgi:hypothetical protein